MPDPMTHSAENDAHAVDDLMSAPIPSSTCWCDGPDCGQTPCVEEQGSTRVFPPTESEETR